MNDDDLLSRLPPEERARVMIDRLLAASGWAVQNAARANLSASRESRYATIVHELGHLYCGHLGTPNAKWWPDRLGLS